MVKKRSLIAIGCLCVIAFLAVVFYRLCFPGLPFLLDYLGETKTVSQNVQFETRTIQIPLKKGVLPVRVYTPTFPKNKLALLVHGVHWRGYDETRLKQFAGKLASRGMTVVTPDVSSLKSYQIVPQAAFDIEQAALWVLEQSGLKDEDGRLGLLGISFAGGLCLSVAGQKALNGRVSYVFSFGGHGNLDETMAFLMMSPSAEGQSGQAKLKPHVYGQAVLVRKFADQLVPADQVQPLRGVVLDYLQGNYKRLKQQKQQLKKESLQLVGYLEERQQDRLARVLNEKVNRFSTAKILSPVKGLVPGCPVFLLHGHMDNVIPPAEVYKIERWAKAKTQTRTLNSKLIGHVELGGDDGVPLLEYWHMIRFWTELLRM